MVSKHTQFEAIANDPEVGEYERISVELNSTKEKFHITFTNGFDSELDGKPFVKPCGNSSNSRRFQERFPERQWLTAAYPATRLAVPVTDLNCIILSSWPLKQAKFSSEALLKVFDARDLVKRQRKAANLIADYRENDHYANGVFKVSERLPLATYQKVALHAATIAKNFALFMEQGTGKTPVAIARICNEAEKAAKKNPKSVYRAIIVCPKNVRYNWVTEFEKFTTCKGLVKIIDGPAALRGKEVVNALVTPSMEEDNEYKYVVLVMNYAAVASNLEKFKMCKAILCQIEGFDFKTGKLFDLGILDESHYIKNPTALRTKAALKLRDTCKARMDLTGTPITNHPFDLYTQLEFLGKGLSGFSSFTAFKNFFGQFESGYGGYEKLVGLQNIPILKERLTRVSFQIKKEEAMPNLPDKVYDCLEVSMTAEQTDVYKKLAMQIAAEIETEQSSGTVKKELAVNHILTKLLRLAQVTSGFVGFSAVRDEDTGEVLEDRSTHVFKENPKLDTLVEVLKEKSPNDKTIVWATFVQDIHSISARLTAEGIEHVVYYGATSDKDRNAAVQAFNEDPTVKVFLANPSAAATGLNLLGYPPGAGEDYETNCNHAIYFSQNWSADKRIQSEDRCHRRGTRQNVRITDLVVPNTIDVEIRRRVEGKRNMAEDVSDVSMVLANLVQMMKGLL